MPRYYLHLHECGDATLDTEGRILPDASAALEAAKKEALTIMSAEVLGGKLCLGCHIEIAQRGSNATVIVPFRDALTLTGLA